MKQLGTLGQSIWPDYIRRDLIASGGLPRLIEEDGLRGADHLRRIFEEGQTIVSEALAASPQQPGIPSVLELGENP
jgi:hypothetical protein